MSRSLKKTLVSFHIKKLYSQVQGVGNFYKHTLFCAFRTTSIKITRLSSDVFRKYIKVFAADQNFFEQTQQCNWYSLLREEGHFYYKHQDNPCMATALQLK